MLVLILSVGRRVGYGRGVQAKFERWAQMVSVLAVVGCRTGGQAVAAADEPGSAAAPVVRVRGCVTIDDAPAPAARVEAYTAGEGRWTVPLGPDGCFFVERPVGGVNALHVSAPERGRIAVPLVPLAGTIELELPLPMAERSELARFRSDDHASRLAALMGWYMSALRGRPSPENLQAVAQRHDAETDPLVRAAYGLVYAVLARTPGVPAGAIDGARVREAIAALSPTHVAWSVEMEAIVLAAQAGDVSADYVRRVFDEHPDPHVFGAAAFMLASAHRRNARRAPRALRARARRREVQHEHLAAQRLRVDLRPTVHRARVRSGRPFGRGQAAAAVPAARAARRGRRARRLCGRVRRRGRRAA